MREADVRNPTSEPGVAPLQPQSPLRSLQPLESRTPMHGIPYSWQSKVSITEHRDKWGRVVRDNAEVETIGFIPREWKEAQHELEQREVRTKHSHED